MSVFILLNANRIRRVTGDSRTENRIKSADRKTDKIQLDYQAVLIISYLTSWSICFETVRQQSQRRLSVAGASTK